MYINDSRFNNDGISALTVIFAMCSFSEMKKKKRKFGSEISHKRRKISGKLKVRVITENDVFLLRTCQNKRGTDYGASAFPRERFVEFIRPVTNGSLCRNEIKSYVEVTVN